MNSQILLKNFLLDAVQNYKHIYLHDIWNFDFEQLENKHDYIQWMFPNKRRSKINIFCPTLKEDTIINNNEIKNNIKNSFLVMLNFYGLKYANDIIVKSDDYDNRLSKWCTKNNHNFLRITRILNCLILFGLKKEANDFLKILTQIYKENNDVISQASYEYWKNTIK